MVTRTTKSTKSTKPTTPSSPKAAKKATVVENTTAQRLDESQDSTFRQEYNDARATLHRMVDDMLDNGGPSWKRTAVAFILSLGAAGLVGYGAGTLLGYLVVGAAVLTQSLFLCTFIYVLGIILAMYVGGKVAGFVYLQVISGTIDHKITAARGWVSDKLSITTARFSMRGAA